MAASSVIIQQTRAAQADGITRRCSGECGLEHVRRRTVNGLRGGMEGVLGFQARRK